MPPTRAKTLPRSFSLLEACMCNVYWMPGVQAIGHYEAAIGLDPKEITFRSNLAAVHFETKNFEEVSNNMVL